MIIESSGSFLYWFNMAGIVSNKKAPAFPGHKLNREGKDLCFYYFHFLFYFIVKLKRLFQNYFFTDHFKMDVA